MTEIRFYHLTRNSLEETLPALLEKTLSRGWRAVVMAGSGERVEALCRHLWTYRDHGFLPHGSAEDGHAEEQPIWLTEKDENPNKASVLMLTDGAVSENVSGYELVCEIFGDNDAAALEASRARWQDYKSKGFALTYWQQKDSGWEKVA
ncbi:MAG TPA: DNA polymerase III subunit chi [Alphaproteobacteria bacterium]|nr:DNA polymerase III subunit chi [Alphaproteobacteria bacterium]